LRNCLFYFHNHFQIEKSRIDFISISYLLPELPERDRKIMK